VSESRTDGRVVGGVVGERCGGRMSVFWAVNNSGYCAMIETIRLVFC
jgi:hypothetical protein